MQEKAQTQKNVSVWVSYKLIVLLVIPEQWVYVLIKKQRMKKKFLQGVSEPVIPGTEFCLESPRSAFSGRLSAAGATSDGL